MSNKEKYYKATANVIKFDVSDPVVTFSGECSYEKKHNPDCMEIYYAYCGFLKATPSDYREGHPRPW